MRFDARRTTGACHQIDVNWLKRQGYLIPGSSRIVPRAPVDDGVRSALVALLTGVRVMCEADNRLTLRYEVRTADGWEWRDQIAFLEWLPAGPGHRPYFGCPICGGRAVKLYQRGSFACRVCHDLAYTSAQSSPSDRAILKIAKIRQRLGGDSNMLGPLPPRRKYMRRATYERLVRTTEILRQKHMQAMLTPSLIKFLGLGP